MSFFDSIPQPPPPEPVPHPRPAWMQPDNVIPGSVPGELLLIRTEDVAVAIGSIRAYPSGFEFTVHMRARGKTTSGQSRPGPNDPFGRFGQHGDTSGDVLQLGLLYADGRRGATTGSTGDVSLMSGGGGGSELRWDSDFWVYPLPPDGPVTFVAAWPGYGAAETTADLDGAAIHAAAARAVVLWPEEPYLYPGGSAAARSRTITAHKVDEPGSDADPQQD